MMLCFFSGTFRAAVRMQARWRGILARRHARAKLRAIHRAEGHGKRRLQQTLVRVFLGYKARKRARLLRRDRAIRRIQDFWRAIYWRRKLRFLRAISLFQAGQAYRSSNARAFEIFDFSTFYTRACRVPHIHQ